MKKILLLAALFTAALAVSCQQKEVAVETPEKTVTEFTFQLPEPDSKLSISSAGKTAWEVGDKIHIHTGHNRDGEAVTVTLTAADISADGKTAHIEYEGTLKAYDYSSWGEGYNVYYAAYPADATNNPTSCYCRNYFSDTNKFLMAAAADDNGAFHFHNLCGIIAFKATGDFDSYVFSGNADEIVTYDTYAVEVFESKQNFMYKATEGGRKKLIGEFTSGQTTYICLPNGVNFTSGFTIEFMDGDELMKVAKTVAPVDVYRGGLLDLGDITSHLKNYTAPTTSDHKSDIPVSEAIDLSAKGSSNCYIVDAAGIYKLPAVKGNSNESAGNVFGVELLWESWNNNEAVEQNSIIEAVDFQDNWIYFKVPATFKPGNAIIAAKNNMDKIIWSWHIWVPIDTPSSADYGLGSPMMNTNLGALKPASEGVDVEAINAGLRYQWGRKDPFPGPAVMKEDDSAVLAGTQISVVHEDGAGPGSVALAIANPTVVYSSNSGDWCAASDDALWGTGKTIYDPCPVGYKVPTVDQLPNFFAADLSAITGWAENADNMYFMIGNPAAIFPMGGYYDDYHSTFDITHAYDRVAYWSATGAGITGKAVDVRYNSDPTKARHSVAGPGKSRAGYVRCIVESSE